MMRRGLPLVARAGVRAAPLSASSFSSSRHGLVLLTSTPRRMVSTDTVPPSAPVRQNVKKSTGIAGLDVVPNAREVLIGLYNKYLFKLEVIDPTSPYRKLIVEENEDIAKIEELIDNGQVEELIQEAMVDIEDVDWWAAEKPWESSPHKRIPVFEREF